MQHLDILPIEIIWSGPNSLTEKAGANGLYQIYGTHPTNGTNNLLYIGKAAGNIDNRLGSHVKWWLNYEANDCYYYKGELSPVTQNHFDKDYTEEKMIAIAESLLIYYCQPPYNSSQKSGLIYEEQLKDKNIIVMNFGKRNLLPYEVSTMHYFSSAWEIKKNKL